MKAGSRLLGLPIMSHEGTKIGALADLLYDDACSRVLGLVFRSGYVRSWRVVGFSEVKKVDRNAIVLSGGTSVRPPQRDELKALATDQRSMQGKPVVSLDGRYLGAVQDVLFDETSGRVIGLEVAELSTQGTRRGRIQLPRNLTIVVSAGPVVIPGAGAISGRGSSILAFHRPSHDVTP